MPTERRIRRDFPNPELAMARVFRARKEYECVWCAPTPVDIYRDGVLAERKLWSHIQPRHVYARISETRLPVCSAHFTIDDVVTLPPKGRTAK